MRILTCVFLIFASQAAFAQGNGRVGWESACESEYCAFRKTLAFVDTQDPFALVEILIDIDSGDSSFVITTPLGISTAPGVRLITRGQDWTVPYRVCFADGCRATLTLDANDLSVLLQNETLEIRYLRFGEKRPVSAVMPLEGLVTTITNGNR